MDQRVLLLIITGASRGYGKAVARAFAGLQDVPTLHFRLCSSPSSTVHLAALAAEIKETRALNASNHATIVECLTSNMEEVALLPDFASLLFTKPNTVYKYTEVIFINNHGSLGELSLIGTHSALRMEAAFNTNVTSTCFLSSEFIKYSKTYPSSTKFNLTNISSLCAIKPFLSWGVYCAGKAARDMYHSVLAEELAALAGPSMIRVLNYAPGPLDTDMQKEIREGVDVHKETQLTFKEMKEKGVLVAPEASAKKLLEILAMNKYKNGSHVDYYDPL